jgi:hypothetical protein
VAPSFSAAHDLTSSPSYGRPRQAILIRKHHTHTMPSLIFAKFDVVKSTQSKTCFGAQTPSMQCALTKCALYIIRTTPNSPINQLRHRLNVSCQTDALYLVGRNACLRCWLVHNALLAEKVCRNLSMNHNYHAYALEYLAIPAHTHSLFTSTATSWISVFWYRLGSEVIWS